MEREKKEKTFYYTSFRQSKNRRYQKISCFQNVISVDMLCNIKTWAKVFTLVYAYFIYFIYFNQLFSQLKECVVKIMRIYNKDR